VVILAINVTLLSSTPKANHGEDVDLVTISYSPRHKAQLTLYAVLPLENRTGPHTKLPRLLGCAAVSARITNGVHFLTPSAKPVSASLKLAHLRSSSSHMLSNHLFVLCCKRSFQ
jgi:hypothetical protein